MEVLKNRWELRKEQVKEMPLSRNHIVPNAEKKLRVAWFSPLTTRSTSPAAYVSHVLLPLLKKRCEIELFHDSFDLHPDFPTFHYLTAWDRHRQNPYDIFFYHLEDHRRTAFARIHLALKPGLVWFHDLLLTDDGPEPILNSAWERVVEKFQVATTPWPERGEEFKRPRPHAVREVGVGGIPLFSSEKDLKEYHLLAARSGRGKGLAFTHPYSEILQTSSAEPLGFFVPYPVATDSVEFSSPIGTVTSRPFTLGLSAAPGIEARVPAILEGLKRLSPQGRPVQLVWLVEDAKEQALAEGMLKDFGVEGLCVWGDPRAAKEPATRESAQFGRGPAEWSRVLPCLDAALHLHFSVFGQPGPALALSMMHGLPCLVSDFGGSDFLPEDAVIKIRAGAGEAQEIAGVVERLRSGAVLVDRARVSAVALERHAAEQIAEELFTAMQLSLPVVKQLQARWDRLEGEASRALLEEVAPRARSWFDNERDLVLKTPFSEFGWGKL
jgi:hypothetical protein